MLNNPVDLWQQLTDVLPAEQREQMAALILHRLGVGWGEVRILIHEHRVERYLEVSSVLARREARDKESG